MNGYNLNKKMMIHKIKQIKQIKIKICFKVYLGLHLNPALIKIINIKV
jgi:hypothetical protein